LCFFLLTDEVAKEVDALAVAVVARRVCAHRVPASALVDIAVAADKEAVADVRPTIGVHVVVLDAAHHRGAVVRGAAGASGAVVDHHIGHRNGMVVGVGRRSGTPLCARHNVWARFEI
jgi:hypothetical protein